MPNPLPASPDAQVLATGLLMPRRRLRWRGRLSRTILAAADEPHVKKDRPKVVPKVTNRLAKFTARQLMCESCGAAFACDPGGSCWCFEVTERLPLPKTGQSQFKDCLCAQCLATLARESDAGS